MLESMVTLEFKQKFDLPRINEYVASLTKFQETHQLIIQFTEYLQHRFIVADANK